MKNGHYRDSATLIEFANMLEKGIEDGEEWTELKAAKKLNLLRSQQKGSIHKLHNLSRGEMGIVILLGTFYCISRN